MKITLKMLPFNMSDISIGLKKYILPWYTLYTNFGSFNEYIMAGRSYYWESLKLEHDYCVEQANGSQFDHKSRFLSTKKRVTSWKLFSPKSEPRNLPLTGGAAGSAGSWLNEEKLNG